MRDLAPWLMFASLAVAAPRMASLFMAMDGRGLEGASFVVVVVVALATSVTLTGGQLFLAWRIATYKSHRIKLSIIWGAILLGATVLGMVAVLLRVVEKGGVSTATSPEWLAAHLPAVLLALAVAGLPEIMAAGLAIAHGDGVVVDETVVVLRNELIDLGSKLLAAEKDVRDAVAEIEAVRKRAEAAEADLLERRVVVEPKDQPSGNGNGSKSKRAGMKLLLQGVKPLVVAKKVGVGRTTVYRWAKEAGKEVEE